MTQSPFDGQHDVMLNVPKKRATFHISKKGLYLVK